GLVISPLKGSSRTPPATSTTLASALSVLLGFFSGGVLDRKGFLGVLGATVAATVTEMPFNSGDGVTVSGVGGNLFLLLGCDLPVSGVLTVTFTSSSCDCDSERCRPFESETGVVAAGSMLSSESERFTSPPSETEVGTAASPAADASEPSGRTETSAISTC